MISEQVRVRIAPSPTGYFHVGTARTAIYNWLFARHTGGKFLLRIEDTDKERSKKEFVDVILDGLNWLGLNWDEEIVYQSSRLHTYKPFAEELVAAGKAYRCFCSAEDLQHKREAAQAAKHDYHYERTCRELTKDQVEANLHAGMPFVIRLKLPLSGTASFADVVLGRMEKDYHDLDDFIILKSDGNAIYNFAVVMDDHEMGITHVIRGNDHITNTFLQKEIYSAFGWKLPAFGHLSLILRPDKTKVSKRKGDKSVDEYQKEGYLPEAILNFLALLGWSPKDDREKMSRQELIDAFSLDGINAANAIFNPEKLTWLNGQYIMEKTNHQLAEIVAPLLIESGLTTRYYLETRWQWLMKIMGMLKERCKLLTDFVPACVYFFSENFEYDEKGVQKTFTKEAAERLNKLADSFSRIDDFSHDKIEAAVRELAESLSIKPAVLIHPTRLAASGMTGGPSLFSMLEAIGKDRVVARLHRAVQYIQSRS
ncbi:MAG: glutamate--tRNA ligase [Candidatus Zixiibacteriota bacterium]